MKRVILKLSGEIFQREQEFGIDILQLKRLAEEIVRVHSKGIELGIMVGGGNFIRGSNNLLRGIDRVTSDYMGMLGTLMNALALQKMIENFGVVTRLQSGIEVKSLAEPFIRRRAIRHIEKGRLLLFACGTGSPYFTTDTASVLRAIELKADAILKGTKVNGVYDEDPLKQPYAKKYDRISYEEFIEKNLRVMDMTAVTLAKSEKIPIVVFDITKSGNFEKVVDGKHIGSIICA
jgi:uridylate kinase